MRTAVASLCVKRTPIRGRYRLHVHMSSLERALTTSVAGSAS